MGDPHPGLVVEVATNADLAAARKLPALAGAGDALAQAYAAGALWVVLDRPPQLERCPDCDDRDDCELRDGARGACDAAVHPRKVIAALRCQAAQGGWLIDQLWLDEGERKRLVKRTLIALRRAAREAGVTKIELDGALLRMPERLQARNVGFAPAPRARLVSEQV